METTIRGYEMDDQAVVAEAIKGGQSIWLSPKAERGGWHKDLIGGKAVRGAKAQAILKEQAQAMENWIIPAIEKADQEEEVIEEFQEEIKLGADHLPIGDEQAKAIVEAENQQTKVQIMTDRLAVHLVQRPKGAKTVTIKCCDCGAERIIKVQDQFQVKRCVNCQKKFRNKKRAERRREKRAKTKAQEQQQN